ncbi:AAA domain-containing protein [Clostridium sp. Marseille-Q7071]
MNYKTKEITNYFRNTVAVQSNMGIDFKSDKFFIIKQQELINGELGLTVCKDIFSTLNRQGVDDEIPISKKSKVSVIICAKTVKTIFSENEKVQDEIDELTGLLYIPAILDMEGTLFFDEGNKKLPWIPREYLTPMIEPVLAIGKAEIVDNFMSDHVDQVEKIKTWLEYVEFFKKFYESVTESEFEQNTIRNMDDKEPFFELENNMYVFIDKTVHSTYHILSLYNHLIKDNQPKPLYDNFISTKITNTNPLIENNLSKMQIHCGQMGGEYPLSPSQREVVNHFNCMSDDEILAVNGPPGTGKTTLLQSIVADMYVKRAINKERAPLIVASSTNNQAVTNIIASFGNIKKVGISNLEERWIEGVNSFATYFPSAKKIKEAKNKGYQYTNQKGEFFVSDVEDKENIKSSKIRLIKSCNEYFGVEYQDITACQDKLHEELLFCEKSKNALLSLAQKVDGYDLNGQTIDKCLSNLQHQIEKKQEEISNIHQRVSDWESYYKSIPFLYKLLRFIKCFSKKIQTEFRLFMSDEEHGFINEYMSFDEIKERYSQRYFEYNEELSDLKKKKDQVQKSKDNMTKS